MKTDKTLEAIYENMSRPADPSDSSSRLQQVIDRAAEFTKTGGNWGGGMALHHIWRPLLRQNREIATAEFVKKGLNQRQIAYIFGDL